MPETPQTCLFDIVCANETFITIYGVIFTIVISLGVYIYGLQNKTERITLIYITKVGFIIKVCLASFATSFLPIKHPLYELLNFGLVGYSLLIVLSAFLKVSDFNGSELSGEKAVKKFKEQVIRQKLKEFGDIRTKNDLLNQELGGEKSPKVKRFLFERDDDSYQLIRSKKSGYITNVDLAVLFKNESNANINETSLATPTVFEYYIPHSVSNGAPVDIDTIVLGVKKKEGQEIDEERLRSFIKVGEGFDNPISYIEAETRSYYPELLALIKLDDIKSLELKLKEFSQVINHFFDGADSYADIVQFTNDDIILPIQEYAFEHASVDCFRRVTAFSLGYIYRAVNNNANQVFNIFLRNLGRAFYRSFSYEEDRDKNDFHRTYFRWLKEVAKYYIKPKLEKDANHKEYAMDFLSNLNSWLKISFDKKDMTAFREILSVLNSAFSRAKHEHGATNVLNEFDLIRQAVVFGFAAHAYKTYNEKPVDRFCKDALALLLSSLGNDSTYQRGKTQDNLNHLLSLYLKATELSDDHSSFGWGDWDKPSDVVYSPTIDNDMRSLLADRILSLIITSPDLHVTIEDKNCSHDLTLINKDNVDFDPLHSKNRDSFIATEHLTEEQFEDAKTKFYEVFSKITQKYKANVQESIIAQSLDRVKCGYFSNSNLESYNHTRTLGRIQKFTKNIGVTRDGFGYSIVLHKNQFVADTDMNYINESDFGEDLARSEDNKVLEEIHKKLPEILPISKESVGEVIASEDDLKAIVLWLGGHLSFDEINTKDFKPYWEEGEDVRKDKGSYYQGSAAGVPIYIVYKLDEHRSYSDTLFLFKGEDSFRIEEFEVERDVSLNTEDTVWYEDPNSCLSISLTNLTNLPDVRTKIIREWTRKNGATFPDSGKRIENLRTNVLFKFQKGLLVESLDVDISKLKAFHLG